MSQDNWQTIEDKLPTTTTKKKHEKNLKINEKRKWKMNHDLKHEEKCLIQLHKSYDISHVSKVYCMWSGLE